MDGSRIARLEDEIEALGHRVALLERPAAAAAPTAVAPRLEPRVPLQVREPAPAAEVPPGRYGSLTEEALADFLGGRALTKEALADLFGGRVLAWVGGLAVLLGLVFLFAIAVSNGWIGEGTRTLMAAAGSTGLLLAGVRLQERGSRADAARSAAAAGIAGLFLTVTVASQVYELVPAALGAMLAVGVGAGATVLAVRWRSRGMAALGVLGAVAAPLISGAQFDGGAMAILFVALAAAAGVLLWQRWDWLALAAFGLATPQWVTSLLNGDEPSVLRLLVTLVAFGVLGTVVALGRDAVVKGSERLRAEPAFLLALNAVVVAAVGWAGFAELDLPQAGKAWLAAVALVHLTVGLAGPRFARAAVSEDLAGLSLVIGVVLADVTFALVTHGVVLSLGWTATTVAFAALVRRARRDERDEGLAEAGIGGHLALALVTALIVGEPFAVLSEGGLPSLASIAVLGALAAGCLVSARLVEDGGRLELRVLLDGLGLATVAFMTALALDGELLVLAWVGEVAALTALAHRREDQVAGWGALGFLALACGHALVQEAPPVSLVSGLAEPFAAVAALGGVAGVALLAGRRLSFLHPDASRALLGAGGVLVLYLASALVVTPFEEGSAVGSAMLSSHQQGQMVLSIFWALVGVGTLVVGLRRDVAALRLAALALLGVTVVKVFLFDFATLTSIYRVVSFIVLGLLLLAGAFVWQQLRPRSDLAPQAPGGSSSS